MKAINNSVPCLEILSPVAMATHFMCISTTWPRTFDTHSLVAKQQKVIVYKLILTSVSCAHNIEQC